MSSFELNKIAGAVLMAGIIAMICGILSDALVKPHKLEKPAYVVEGVEAAASPAGGAPAEAKLEPIAPLLAKADANEGANIAKQCAACHTFDKGGANRIGPNLYGIIGEHPAEVQGYEFSKALQALKDKTWDYETLNQWLASPKAVAPGTKMTFAGLRKPEQRADVIMFLRSKADTPAPLP
jgi:cytochrome c